MKFQVGDKVVIRHTSEEAQVVEIINKQMVLLEIGQISFPAYADELDFPYFKNFTQKKEPPPPKEKTYIDSMPVEKKSTAPRTEDGVWLTVIPVFESDVFGDDTIEALKIHLVNRTASAMHFRYEMRFSGVEGFSLKNELQPFEDFYLHDIAFEQVNDSPVLGFEFSLCKPEKGKAPYFEHLINLKPKQVYKQVMEIREKGEPTFSFMIAARYPDKPVEPEFDAAATLKKKGAISGGLQNIRSHFDPPKTVLDLHVEVLEPAYEQMTGGQIITLQLRTFEKYLDLAIVHHLQQMIVIHGVGSGKLKDEIHDILRSHRHVSGFVNRYHPAYGYGATEIHFQ